VFPDQIDNPDAALESTLTAGGIVEVLEEEMEARETRRAVVTPLRGRRTPPAA
jgi:phosphosulfolactate phosphohydrolase-like enzyme